MTSALLLLADGRLPTGGHAHSGGLEEAVAAGRVRVVADLAEFLGGRLRTVGRADAALGVATWARCGSPTAPDWSALDDEAGARTPAPALRRAGRAQGRGLLRAGRRSWPSPLLDGLAAASPHGPYWPVALGAVGWAAGCDAADVALVALQAAISGPAWAATRLLGMDPLAVASSLAGLAADVDREVTAAQPAATEDLADLVAPGAPLLELGAQAHAGWEVRLFAS